MSDLTGKILDRKYKLARKIGEGGMGSVWIGEHVMLGRKVAVKIMHTEYSDKPESVDRFFLEAQTASSIGHPNIVEIQDVGKEEDGTVYIVMELLKGRSLKGALLEHKKLESPRAIAIILQVASALNAAHTKGIIHRDLKPDNVFLSFDSHGREEIKLLDFGIAKFQGDAGMDLSLTKTGVVLGTPNYLAPEQARGQRDIDPRIDIWSAGVLLYEILAGRLPFQGETYNEVMGKILLDEPPFISEFTPGIDPSLEDIVMKALSKDREQRFFTMVEMIEALRPFSDVAEGIMSTSAVEALRTTVPPPAMMLHKMLDRDDADAKVTDAIMPTIADDRLSVDTDIPRNTNYTPHETVTTVGISLGNKAAAALAVLMGGGLLVGILLLFLGGETLNKLPEEQTGTSLSSVVNGIPASLEAKAADALKDDTSGAAAAIEPNNTPVPEPGEPAPVAEPELVTISFTNLPSGSTIQLDGEDVEIPLKIPRGDTERTIEITAEGYRPYETTFAPSEDREIRLFMTKASKRVIMPQKKKRRAKRKPSTKKSNGDDWAPNPFGN